MNEKELKQKYPEIWKSIKRLNYDTLGIYMFLYGICGLLFILALWICEFEFAIKSKLTIILTLGLLIETILGLYFLIKSEKLK